VDTATDCHLQYKPISRNTLLSNLDYVQPKSVPSKSASPNAATTQLMAELVAGRSQGDTEIRIMYNPTSSQDKLIYANE